MKVIDSPVDVYVFRASFSAFFCKTLQRYCSKLLKPVSMEEKVQKKCRKVIFSAFLILAPEPYCQILLIYAKIAHTIDFWMDST